MVYAVEAWSKPTSEDEDPVPDELAHREEFSDEAAAARWAWRRLTEGYLVLLYPCPERS